MIKILIEIEPIPQPRPRFSRFGTYEPKRITEYKGKIKAAGLAAMAGREVIQSAVEVRIKLYRKYKRCSRRYGDVDNRVKAICDALNKVVYADDSQIVRCLVEKFTDKEQPRIEIEIKELADDF